MSIVETGFKAANIIIGVDTHKSTHVAVAINEQGAHLAVISIPANSKGYIELNSWSRSLGLVQAFGIEGTGSYGASLSHYLMSLGLNVIEITRPNRQLRYQQGKNDSLDAEGAARSVLSGQAIAAPKTQSGSVEMIRHLKIARDTAVKSCSVAMEVCANSHHWAREIGKLGHETHLIPSVCVKPFGKRQKNNANDEEAIAEAASRLMTIPSVDPTYATTIQAFALPICWLANHACW